MPSFLSRVRIEAPIEIVFDFATDLSQVQRWMPKVTAVERLDDGPLRPGSRFRETRKMGKRSASATIEVQAHERPSRHMARSRALGVECVYDFRFLPDGDTTTVELEGSARGRWLSKLLAPMFLKIIQKEDGDILERLKAAIEGNQADAAPARS